MSVAVAVLMLLSCVLVAAAMAATLVWFFRRLRRIESERGTTPL